MNCRHRDTGYKSSPAPLRPAAHQLAYRHRINQQVRIRLSRGNTWPPRARLRSMTRGGRATSDVPCNPTSGVGNLVLMSTTWRESRCPVDWSSTRARIHTDAVTPVRESCHANVWRSVCRHCHCPSDSNIYSRPEQRSARDRRAAGAVSQASRHASGPRSSLSGSRLDPAGRAARVDRGELRGPVLPIPRRRLARATGTGIHGGGAPDRSHRPNTSHLCHGPGAWRGNLSVLQ